MKSKLTHLLGRGGWLILGILLLYDVLPGAPNGPTYDRVIVPVRAIETREMPAKPRIIDHLSWKFPAATVTAVAPGGGLEEASAFCRPVVARIRHDTAAAAAAPRRELVRSADVSEPWLPFRPTGVFISSVSSGDELLGRDYEVHGSWGLRSGDSLLVRHQRLWPVKELVRGTPWIAVGAILWVVTH